MHNLKFLLLSILLILITFNVASGEVRSKINSQSNFAIVKFDCEGLPNVFRQIGELLNRIIRKKRFFKESGPAVINNVYFSQTTVTKGCLNSQGNLPICGDQSIIVTTDANDFTDDVLLYSYKVSGGKIIGDGSIVVWNLADALPGIYTIEISVDDGCGACSKPFTKEIKVVECENCIDEIEKPSQKMCPQGISIKPSQDKVKVGETGAFTVSVGNWNNIDESKFVFNWSISNGEIVGGQKTKTLIVRVLPNFTGQTISATVSAEDELCLHNPPSAMVEITKP